MISIWILGALRNPSHTCSTPGVNVAAVVDHHATYISCCVEQLTTLIETFSVTVVECTGASLAT